MCTKKQNFNSQEYVNKNVDYLNEQLRHETSRQNDHMTWILTVHAVLVILMSVSQWIGDNNRLS